MRKESPLIVLMDGDRLVGLWIHCPTAASSQPNKLELELVRIFEEYKKQQKQIADQQAEIERLKAALANANIVIQTNSESNHKQIVKLEAVIKQLVETCNRSKFVMESENTLYKGDLSRQDAMGALVLVNNALAAAEKLKNEPEKKE